MHNTHAPPSIDRHIHVLGCRPRSVNVARRTDSDGCLCARVRARRQLPREHALRDVGLDVWTRIARPRWAEMIGGRVGANAAARGPDAVVASPKCGEGVDGPRSLLGLRSECLRRRDGSSCAAGRRLDLTSTRAGHLLRLPLFRGASPRLPLPIPIPLPCLPPGRGPSPRHRRATGRSGVRARALAGLMVVMMVPVLLRVFRATPKPVSLAPCRTLALLPTILRLPASAALRELTGEPLPLPAEHLIPYQHTDPQRREQYSLFAHCRIPPLLSSFLHAFRMMTPAQYWISGGKLGGGFELSSSDEL